MLGAGTAAGIPSALPIIHRNMHHRGAEVVDAAHGSVAVDRAMGVFWRQGFDATSTSDLERQMEVNR